MSGASRAEALQRYWSWNSAIYTALFSDRRAQAPVYLYLEPEILGQAAQLAGAPAQHARADLVETVRRSLGWDKADTPFLWHIGEASVWAEDGMKEAPPFLALLSVLVLAAESMVSDAEHAAHNYYDRLFELLGADQALEGRIRRSFKDTVELWHLLNDWLVQWEGELGLPSAQITDRRVNVGYPISQALVSAQDRRRLAGAFEDYGLRPGRRMAPLEMEQYLGHWLSLAGAPARLRRIWGNEEARRRISQIACAELEAWPGPITQAEAGRAGGRIPLLWRAELSRGALPAIDLYLACQADRGRVEGSYQISAPTDATGRSALVPCEAALAIRQIAGSELCGLEPWNELPAGALLAGAFTIVRREAPSITITRSSNPILVLAHDDRDGLWHEVSRAQLLERCIVLAHADVLLKVEAHLRRYARAGYEQLDSQRLEGLPSGWAAFVDVVLADAPEVEAPGVLATLSPLRADVISLEGGIRLGRQTWHVDAPPEVVATLAAERRLRLEVDRRRALDDGPDRLALGDHLGRTSRPLAGQGLGNGDYLVELSVLTKEGPRSLDRAPMRLRSGSFPRPARPDATSIRGHLLAKPSGLVSAESDDGCGPIVAGAQLLRADVAGHEDQAPALPPSSSWAERPARTAQAREVDKRTYSMPCAVLGHHYWVVDAAEPGDDWRTLKHMRCRECQREEWTRNRGRRPRAARPMRRSSHGVRAPEPPRARLPAVYAGAWGRPVMDLMLDALSYMGSGSWAMLREMAQALHPDQPWLAVEAARALSALGHLDISLDPRTQRPIAWQISPATLVETSDGSWVLAGARSDRLVDAILGMADLKASREGDGAGLAVLRIALEGEAGALELARRLEASGAQLGIAGRFSERLARQLPALPALLTVAEQFRIGSDRVERLDLATGQWMSAGEERAPGAYRIEHHGRLHGVITGGDGDGIMRVTDPLSVKHLAAAEAGRRLAAYDPVQQAFSVPIGAELPGLLDRAATLCSGSPAIVQRETWSVHYPNVPPLVAGHIQRCLGL